MRVRSGRRGLRLELEPAETQILLRLLDELDALLETPSPGTDATDEVIGRLFPAAYEDDDDATAFRSITESELRTARGDRVAACRAELDYAGREIALAEPDATTRWLQVTNDLRLALGTRLGITADSHQRIDPDDPNAQALTVYHWLTALQDSLVRAIR